MVHNNGLMGVKSKAREGINPEHQEIPQIALVGEKGGSDRSYER